MTPQELRASILQQAIQGKLVEHYESDKAISINSTFSCDAAELFEVPENWKWLSIKDIASVNTGLSFKKQDQMDSRRGSLRVLRGGNIGDDYKYHLYDDDVYVDLEQFQTKYIQLLRGDVIMPSVTSMEKMCKTGFIDRNLAAVTAGGFVYIIRCLDETAIDPKYLLFFISSAFNKEQCKPNIHKSGQAFYNLKKSGFIEQPICVPPLAEQRRIVAKIEEILPLIDRYEAAWNKLEEFNKRFPGDMQKSILQLAIQGKLVEQRSEEGTGEELFQQIQAEKQAMIKAGKIKKEKPMPEITADELPFDIPDTWKWIRVGNIFNVGTGMTPLKTEPRFFQGGTIPWVTSSLTSQRYIQTAESYVTEYALENTSLVLYPANTLLIAMYGQGKTRGQVSQLLIDATINQACAALGNIITDKWLIAYVYYFFLFNYEVLRKKAEGTSQPNLNLSKIKETLLPLPPVAEQKRIVAKLEEILPLCDRLK